MAKLSIISKTTDVHTVVQSVFVPVNLRAVEIEAPAPYVADAVLRRSPPATVEANEVEVTIVAAAATGQT